MRTNFLLLMPLCIGLILSPGTGTAFAQAEDPVVDVAAARGYPPQQSIQVRELGEFLGRYVTVRVSERLDRPTRVRLQVEAISRDGERVSGWLSRDVEVEPGVDYRGATWTSGEMKVINTVFEPEDSLVMGDLVEGRSDVFPDVCKREDHALQLSMETDDEHLQELYLKWGDTWPTHFICMDWKR